MQTWSRPKQIQQLQQQLADACSLRFQVVQVQLLQPPEALPQRNSTTHLALQSR